MLNIVIKRLKRIMLMRLRRPFALTQFVLIFLILYLVKRTRDRHKHAPPGEWTHDGSMAKAAQSIDSNGGVGLFEDSQKGVQEAEGELGKLFETIRNKRDDIFPKPEEDVPAVAVVGVVDERKVNSVFKSSQGDVPVPPGDPSFPPGQPNIIAAPLPPDILATPLPIQANIAAALARPDSPVGVPADSPPAPGASAAAPVHDSATYHFPVPGEEVAMGVMDDPYAGQQNPDILAQPAQEIPGQDMMAQPIQDLPQQPVQDIPAQPVLGPGPPGGFPVPPQAANPPVYDEAGLEIIPRPAEMSQLNPRRFSLEVTEDMINKFSVTLPPLLPNYKNPCWEEDLPNDFTYDDSFFNTCHYIPHTNKLKHGAQYKNFERILQSRVAQGTRTRIRCFPYFFLIGVGKCGTTDVFDTLKKYFWELAPVFLKEPHYWEWKRCIDKLQCRGVQRTPTFSEYLDSFDAASDFVREKKMIGPDGQPYNPLMIGDFTPSTLAFHPCWKLMPGNEVGQEPRFMNAHYIKALRPETKFIAIMRDPVERVFSNFRMHDRMSSSAEAHDDAQTFHDEMVEVIQYLTNCMKYKTARACTYSIMKFDFGTHVTNSIYEVFISDWFKIFPKEQFLFLRMEDYMEDRVPNFRRVVDFLEIDAMPPEKEMMIGSKSVTNQAPPAAMFNETRILLQDFYRPFNRRLAEILGDPGWNWGY